MPKKDDPFKELTPKEKRLVGFHEEPIAKPGDAEKRQAQKLGKGRDPKKLERELRRLT